MAIYVLGARDPEMDRIEELCIKYGIFYIYAEIDGKRCHPGNAYQYQPAETNGRYVECGNGSDLFRIDHHREGDPGWGSDAIESSSLFQFLKLEGIKPTDDDYVIAALDCNGAKALQGKYKDVDKDRALEIQCRNIAKANQCDTRDIRELVGKYAYVHSGTPYLGIGYNIKLLSYLTATAMTSVDVEYTAHDSEESLLKLCFKSEDSSKVSKKMELMAKEGLINIYGNPSRGYCGGYYPQA